MPARSTILVAAPTRRARPSGGPLGSETALAYTILTPTFLVILGWSPTRSSSASSLTLQSKMVGAPGRFVGLQNYVELFRSDLFFRTSYNTVVYTVVGVAIKFVFGWRWP